MRLDQSLRHQVVDRADHEQRIAFRAFMDQGHELGREPVRRKPRGEMLRDRRLAEIVEGELFAQLPGEELSLDRLHRMAARDQFRRPQRRDQHQVSGSTAPGDIRDQVKGRDITPVEILQDHHERGGRGERLEGLGHFPEHALARPAKRFAAQRVAIRGREQRGHLEQPHRRVGAQDLDRPRVVAAQLSHRLEDGEIGLTHAVLLQALTAADAHGRA